MKENISGKDKIFRYVAFVVFLLLGLWTGGWLKILFFVLSGIALITAFFSYCPLYTLISCNTKKSKPKTSSKKSKSSKTNKAVKKSAKKTKVKKAKKRG